MFMPIVSGRVLDSLTEEPVENATVVSGESFALTDEMGNFVIDLKREGNQKFIVIQRYYKKFVFTADVFDGLDLIIYLERE